MTDKPFPGLNPGILCPRCGSKHLPALHTRRRGNTMVRARICKQCNYRIVTREKIQTQRGGT